MAEEPQTWNDFVRSFIPEPLTDEECAELLWSCSCYPFGAPEQVKSSLLKSWEGGGRTVEGAMAHAENELDISMEAIREQENKNE